MELEPRQGDLFLDLLQGGKAEERPNYRAKIDEHLAAKVQEPEPKPLPNPG